MMGWKLCAPLALVLLHLSFTNPQCLVCSTPTVCGQLNGEPITSTNVTIRCASTLLDDATGDTASSGDEAANVTALINNTYTSARVYSSAGDEPEPLTLESLFHDRATFSKVRFLNVSNNSLDSFSGYFDSLVGLELSHNVISNIYSSQFHSPKLAHLDLSNNTLTSLSNFSHDTLQYLKASSNKIKTMALGKLPRLVLLNVGENEITTIDGNLSSQAPRLEILNLSTNAIAQLNDYNLNLTYLLRLYLRDNKIAYLSEKCFYGLSRLQLLDISDNQITTVFPGMFQYIPLVQLIVSDNPGLITQDFGILLASERLKSVNASKTNQVKIPSCLTRSIRYLSLSHNKINQIQCGDLDSYPLLNSLDLSYNNISFIEDDALGRLELLEIILLSHNRLKSIPYTLSSNLMRMYLDHNYLSRVTPSDFSGLLKLEFLDLSGNNVSSIADGSFSQMYGLASLNLSTNPLDVISISTFSGPHKLRSLDLSHLGNVNKCTHDLCFPVPEPNELTELYIKDSPELGHRLMNDAAAMKTFKQLSILNIENCNLTEVIDFSSYFPRLRSLYIEGNEFNCTRIQEVYVWSDVSRVTDCTFIINERPTTTSPTMMTTSNSQEAEGRQDNATAVSPTTSSSTENSLEKYIMNNSLRYSEEAEVISNEIWISDDQMGDVDAYSAEAPSSHPGLFIMLLVPVTLACAILVFNYSRLKRKISTERRCEMDIEISNISSELW